MATEHGLTAIPTERTCPFDPPAPLGLLRAQRTVAPFTFPDGHEGWIATGHAAVRTVLTDPRFSHRADLVRPTLAMDRVEIPEVLPGMFTRLDPPEHTRYRRLLGPEFTPRRLAPLVPRIEQIAEEHLEAMVDHGSPVDLVRAFALPLPSLVMCEILGLPYSEHERFQHDSEVLFDLSASEQDTVAAWTSMLDFLTSAVADKRDHPADDLLGRLVADGSCTDGELVTVAMILLMAGHETTSNTLALGTFALLENPAQRAALLADPDTAVEELLRYLTVSHIGPVRTALEDVEVAGRLVRAGQSVTLSLAAANRDPARYDRPDELDLTRDATGHLAFGGGVHLCTGLQLARIELRTALTALFRRFPDLRLAVPAAEVPLRTTMVVYGVHALPVAWA
ncbi:cytochrome P450 [Actinosynnema sp. NPDC047251]|uniref:Cytochrome P450 family protein n=1 Tax=Saccharothrix espanaensis (strain ATCC 51144 / DSM 44229 / JCM 9112 / NBRC 15066 / NRRL 15764) TaxID=1179773 RepID=K0K127_SACES|nr:cytochrome P450 [Saccharothrix espanaensis]CCH32041.1 Cytochrome P450 family protein [Saccharothrix espanaensis DSM 44229]